MNNFIERITKKEYEELKLKSDVQIILIEGKYINSKNDVFDAFHDQTGVEYMSRNWNSLDEILKDCDWMKRKSIFILHDGMPKLSQENEDIYERILETAVKIHKDGPRKNFILPQIKIDFHVALIEG